MKPPLNRFRAKRCTNSKQEDVIDKPNYLNDCMTIHANAILFSKQATQYMFLANGVAITTLLVRVDIEKYMISFIVFCFGVIYSIFISQFMYFRSIESIITYFKNNEHPLRYFHDNIYFRVFIFFISYIPSFLFLYGIYTVVEITSNNTPKGPFESLWILLKSIYNLVLNL